MEKWDAIFAHSSPALSTYGEDTNYRLLISALRAMRSTTPHPAAVLIGGDFLGHHFQELFQQTARDHSQEAFESFVDKTMAFLARKIAGTFPDTQILPALGNNDSYCGDYQTEPGGRFLRRFAEIWAPLVNRHGAAPDFVNTFAAGDTTRKQLAFAPGPRAVIVNSLFWSPRYVNRCGAPGTPPGDPELAWLNYALYSRDLLHQPVLLVGHVPPGIDAFATLRGHGGEGSCASRVRPMYRDNYAAELLQLLSAHPAPYGWPSTATPMQTISACTAPDPRRSPPRSFLPSVRCSATIPPISRSGLRRSWRPSTIWPMP